MEKNSNHNIKYHSLEIKWLDAVLFSDSFNPNIPTLMVTRGEIVKENNDWIIIKDPLTKTVVHNNPHPPIEKREDKKITFMSIPKGMIKIIKELD